MTIGVPTSTAFSKPVITPEEKVCHPRPNTAKMITTNKMKPNKPILDVYTKTSYKIYINFIIEECTSHHSLLSEIGFYVISEENEAISKIRKSIVIRSLRKIVALLGFAFSFSMGIFQPFGLLSFIATSVLVMSSFLCKSLGYL
ncbi:MAG: hypothetical protein WA941_02965 [Nitrososphaeraceae archaeon]